MYQRKVSEQLNETSKESNNTLGRPIESLHRKDLPQSIGPRSQLAPTAPTLADEINSLLSEQLRRMIVQKI